MTIQNIYNVSELNQLGTIIAVIFGVAMLIFFILIFVFGEMEHIGLSLTSFLFTVTFFIMLIVTLSCSLPKTYDVIPHYEITLDEDYPATKLLEDYDIQEVRGQIFDCTDKEVD